MNFQGFIIQVCKLRIFLEPRITENNWKFWNRFDTVGSTLVYVRIFMQQEAWLLEKEKNAVFFDAQTNVTPVSRPTPAMIAHKRQPEWHKAEASAVLVLFWCLLQPFGALSIVSLRPSFYVQLACSPSRWTDVFLRRKYSTTLITEAARTLLWKIND